MNKKKKIYHSIVYIAYNFAGNFYNASFPASKFVMNLFTFYELNDPFYLADNPFFGLNANSAGYLDKL